AKLEQPAQRPVRERRTMPKNDPPSHDPIERATHCEKPETEPPNSELPAPTGRRPHPLDATRLAHPGTSGLSSAVPARGSKPLCRVMWTRMARPSQAQCSSNEVERHEQPVRLVVQSELVAKRTRLDDDQRYSRWGPRGCGPSRRPFVTLASENGPRPRPVPARARPPPGAAAADRQAPRLRLVEPTLPPRPPRPGRRLDHRAPNRLAATGHPPARLP